VVAYMHMGHDTENLVGEEDLEEYGGIILSPINREPQEMEGFLSQFRKIRDYDVVFDPQLYFPRSQRGKLHKHPYYPSDLDTADVSPAWWDSLLGTLSEYLKKLGVNCVTSPAMYPRIWSDDYYASCAEISCKLSELLATTSTRVLTTVMVNVSNMTDISTVLRTASILSSKPCSGYYVVFDSVTPPRREFSVALELSGMMQLIRELASTGLPVLVSHCSSDMFLYKAAGASHCATGKFFNLRRFTKSRYDEPAEGGGQLPYWFEHSLMAFLREADILRLRQYGHSELVGVLFSGNTWGGKILRSLADNSGHAWIRMGWRQYLSWFAKADSALASGNVALVNKWLVAAEDNWRSLEDDGILFEEPRNNGTWLRPWRQALNKFARDNRV
jgi:hypothetical protein